MLLRFRVVNHRCLRDEAELSLVSERFSGAVPSGGWRSVVRPVAGIYGANASGKSTVLDAIHFAVTAIRNSATLWADKDGFPHRPFALDEESPTRPSVYEFDFVASDDTRYNYGFESDSDGIRVEWLYSYPKGRKRLLFEREEGNLQFRRGLDGEHHAIAHITRRDALFLSTAAVAGHPVFTPLARHLANRIGFARFDDDDREARLRMVHDAIEDADQRGTIEDMVRKADLGITGIRVETKEMPDHVRSTITAILTAVEDARRSSPDSGVHVETPDTEQVLTNLSRKIRFSHSAGPNRTMDLSINDESRGTVAWLALALPAMRALRNGDVLLADEIDSSLHPRLSAALIELFTENRHSGGQLIFTSHDTSLLGPMSAVKLERDCIWFTEKALDGSVELYCLADFRPRSDHNIERRYLQGRYGAVPVVAWEDFASLSVGASDELDAAGDGTSKG